MGICANELRIGNWVMYSSKIQVNENKIRECVDHPDRFVPITITEEWLQRFGFEKDEEYDEGGLVDYRWILMNGSLEFVSFWNSEEITGVNQPQTGVDVEYVHQIQNLYFALTGQELQTDEEANQ